MHEKGPQAAVPEEEPPGPQPIETWAEENEKTQLLSHIQSAGDTYRSLGIRDSFYYDQTSGEVTIILPPGATHTGHEVGGKPLVHGGIFAFLVDAGSGAAAFAQAADGQVPVTRENRIQYHRPGVSNGEALVSVSTVRERDGNSMIITTVISQPDASGSLSPRVSAESSITLVDSKIIGRAVRGL